MIQKSPQRNAKTTIYHICLTVRKTKHFSKRTRGSRASPLQKISRVSGMESCQVNWNFGIGLPFDICFVPYFLIGIEVGSFRNFFRQNLFVVNSFKLDFKHNIIRGLWNGNVKTKSRKVEAYNEWDYVGLKFKFKRVKILKTRLKMSVVGNFWPNFCCERSYNVKEKY